MCFSGATLPKAKYKVRAKENVKIQGISRQTKAGILATKENSRWLPFDVAVSGTL